MNREAITELEQVIKAQENLIKVLRTNIEHPHVLERSLAHDEALLAKVQARITATRAQIENSPKLLESTINARKINREKLFQLRHAAKIERLERLARGIAELEAEGVTLEYADLLREFEDRVT